MAKLLPSFSLVLLVFFTFGTTIRANTCTEGLGLCGKDCDARCRSRHQGISAQGSCDSTIKPMLCTCAYECHSPPAPKTCEVGLGMCEVESCGDSCCDKRCASKYYQGSGYCYTFGILYVCQCSYTC